MEKIFDKTIKTVEDLLILNFFSNFPLVAPPQLNIDNKMLKILEQTKQYLANPQAAEQNGKRMVSPKTGKKAENAGWF